MVDRPWAHMRARQQEAVAAFNANQSARALILACFPSSPCGGHADRWKGILVTFLLALLTDRAFFVYSPDPVPLEFFLQPSTKHDWRVPAHPLGPPRVRGEGGPLRRRPGGHRRRAHE